MALRILTTVNYSAGENAPGDSGLMFTTGLIASLVEYDPSLHFYVLVPNDHYHAWSALLPSKRVTPIPLPMAPRLHGGDFQFEPTAIYNAFDFKRFDIDVLFLNQLETVPAFLQFLNRHMFHNVPAVSYVHWFDTRRPSTPKQRLHFPALLAALAGMEASTAIGCNSAFGRDKVLLAAGRWFNQATLSSLAERMVVLPPGVSVREIIAQRSCRKRGRARAIVSHRLLKYTGVRHLLVATLPRLLRNRCDLEVLVTNPTRVRLPRGITELPRLRVATLSRADYIKALWESDIVIAPHRATHWS
ncbi:MAG TPA: hypothetical protein VGQ17_11315, partial [Gemmatimonadales bacterium]|nr:hypothetical protein [Gemmatimonadales bacterium]